MADQALSHNDIQIFVNIPICEGRCSYCNVPTWRKTPQLMRSYGDALLAQIRAMAPEVGDKTVREIYIGGGTPAMLGPTRNATLIGLLKSSFRCSDHLSITYEATPNDLNGALIGRIRDAGVTNLNLGFCTANANEHGYLKRPYNFPTLGNIESLLGKWDIPGLSFDILCGIQEQSIPTLRDTLQTMGRIAKVDHVQLLPFEVPEDSILADLQRQGKVDTVASQRKADLYSFACGWLRDNGYTQYTVFHFAKPGKQNPWYRHNDCMDRLGFGLGATSILDGVHWGNTTDMDTYIEGSANIDAIACNMVRPDAASLQKQYVLTHLQFAEGVSVDDMTAEMNLTDGDRTKVTRLMYTLQGRSYVEKVITKMDDGVGGTTRIDRFLLTPLGVVELLAVADVIETAW